MGAITTIATGGIAFAIIASYIFLRIAPGASRAILAPRHLRVEQNKELTQERQEGHLNQLRLEFDAKRKVIFEKSLELRQQETRNEGLTAHRDRLETADTEAASLVDDLGKALDNVAPDATFEIAPDGTLKVTIPEKAKSAAEPPKKHVTEKTPQETTTSISHPGIAPTTADQLVGPDAPKPGSATPIRQQPGKEKGNGRST